MAVHDLAALLSRLEGVKACVLGDVMLDRFVYGAVERISPEAPIPVMTRSHAATMLGGAGNVARNLSALGVSTHLCGWVGEDADGAALRALVAAEPRLVDGLKTSRGRPTTVKTRFLAGGQQLLRLDVEASTPVAEGLVATGEAALLDARALVISDYAKGCVTQNLIEVCHAVRARTGAVLIVDPKGSSFARYGAADLIKPNARELALVTGLPTTSDVEVERALEAALDACSAAAILVTRAASGLSLMRRGGRPLHVSGRPRQVFDVSGAGDTALAALGAALAAGEDLEGAAALALLASGLVVAKSGTAVVRPAELLDARRADLVHESGAKTVSAETAEGLVEAWRAAGARIGFTNGCFDVLHRGHVAYLAESRRRCDRLVVGLNTDASVRRLKGEGRPVNDLDSRAYVLGGLESVDLIVPFCEDTPLDLITRLRPDVLMKGADYVESEVVGAAEVREAGGDVVLIPLIPGQSTTATLRRMGEGA